MKRLVIVAIMAAFLLGTVGAAQAAQIQAKGDWQMSTNYVKNPRFDRDFNDDSFQAVQRLRTQFEFVANENLKAVLRLHIENRWGQAGHGIGVSGRNTLGYDLAYLDFIVPNTELNIKAGKQLITLPNSIGSHIFDEFAYGVVASTPFNDMVGLSLGWARLSDALQHGQDDSNDGWADTRRQDELDMFFAIVPVTLDGFEINPFGAYVYSGRDTRGALFTTNADYIAATGTNLVIPAQDKSQKAWFAGINATMDLFDPIVVMADFNYGSRSESIRGTNFENTRGWIAALAVQYKMDMFTPMIYGLYESGEDRNSGNTRKGKRMPNLGTGDLYGLSSFAFNGSSFRGQGRARLNTSNVLGAGDLAMLGDDEPWGASGKWGVGFKLLDINFIDKLSHEFQIAYYKGTNDRNSIGMFTTRDKAWETNFNSTYQMFENLAAIVELGYLDLDINGADLDSAWKAAAGVRYRF